MYLDSSIYVKCLVDEPDSLFYIEAMDRQKEVWASEILLTEACSALLRKERENLITKEHRLKALDQMFQDYQEGALKLVPVDQGLLKKANQILEICHPEISLRSLDVIHLASFDFIQKGPLLTNDLRMRQAAEKMKFPLHPLPPA